MGAPQSKPRAPKPFVVLAEIYTRSAEKTSIQLDLLKPVTEYELQQKSCGTYFLLLPADSDDGQTTITLFESYDSRSYMYGHHHHSDTFQKMKDLEAANNIRRAKTVHYIMQPSGGFLERGAPSGIAPSDQFYRITRLQCDPANRAEAVATLTAHAEYLWKNTNEVLSYFVGTHTENLDAFLLLERYPSGAIARSIWSLKSSQVVVSKLLSLKVTQMTTDYRAVGGFLSKKEKLI